MLDSLDLQELQARGEAYRHQHQKPKRRALIFAAIVLAIAIFVQLRMTAPGELYRQSGDSWKLDHAIDLAWSIEYADDGTLWALDTYGILHRYAGDEWISFDRGDFGTNNKDVNRFSIHGSEVWAIVGTDIVHFDGEAWTAYNGLLALNDGAEIAAGNFGVVVIDGEGTLLNYDGREWQRHAVADVLPEFPYNYDAYVSMIGDEDAVWLLYGALWRFDGENWELILDYWLGTQHRRLIGGNSQAAYIDYRDSLIVISATAPYKTTQYRNGDLSFPENQYLTRAIMRDGVLWLTADNALYTFDGREWQLADGAFPEIEEDRLWEDFDFAPDGSLSFANLSLNYDEIRGTYVGQMAIIASIPLLLIFTLLYYGFSVGKSAMMRAELVRKRLLTLLPAMPEYAPLHQDAKKTNRRQIWTFIVFFLAIFIVRPLLNLGVTATFGFILIAYVLWVSQSMLLRLSDSRNTLESRAYLIRNTIKSVVMFGGALAFILVLIPFMNDQVTSLALPMLANDILIAGIPMILVILVWVIFYLIGLLPVFFIRGPLNRGDYDGAIARITWLRGFIPRYLNFLIQHTFVIVMKGDYEQAKTLYEEALAEAQNSGSTLVSVLLMNYSIALRHLGQEDQALQMLEAAVKMSPESAQVYKELAQYYQFKSVDPQRTLEITDVMMKFARKPRFNLSWSLYGWGDTLGTRAVALANVGRFDEAESLMQRAFAETNQKFKPGLALLHLKQAAIALAKGDSDQQHHALQQALTLDPNGSAGKHAREQLTQFELL